MPKKLMDCVRKVQAQGKSKSSAYGICVSSTGLKPEHHKANRSKRRSKRD